MTRSRHNKKALDLSLTYRLSNLPSGAQLELVQASRSPSVVSVALQLPASENNVRLTDKFPSTTPFWQILRRFESGAAGAAAGSSRNMNFTQRGVPQMNGRESGSGRLNYEMPVIQVMNRELSTFEDLQKTMAQVGLNSGSALLRVNFKNSGRPLEEVMSDISKYFQAEEAEEAAASSANAMSGVEAAAPSETPEATVSESQESNLPVSPPPPPAAEAEAEMQNDTAPPSASTSPPANVDGPANRPITVFAAPTAPSPQDPRFAYNDSDYEPTVDHAKHHQARLNSETRNRRLPSDAEIAAAEKAKEEKLAAVTAVRLRIRFPDQMSIEIVFKPQEPASSVYDAIRPMLESEGEPFVLRYPGPNGQQTSLPDGPQKLVPNLKMQPKTLMNFAWEEEASVAARQKPVLKSQHRQQAQQIKIDTPVQEPDNKAISIGKAPEKSQQKSTSGGGDKEAKLKKLLGFGKK